MLKISRVFCTQKNIENLLAKHAQTVIKCAFLDNLVNNYK